MPLPGSPSARHQDSRGYYIVSNAYSINNLQCKITCMTDMHDNVTDNNRRLRLTPRRPRLSLDAVSDIVVSVTRVVAYAYA